MRKLLTILFVLGAIAPGVAQHIAVNSQYMMNGLVINPAYAGSREAMSASMSFRKQWTGIEGAPTTMNLSMHGPLKKKNIAIGLMIYRDVIGVTAENAIYANYAYRLPLEDGTLSFGLASGVSFLRADWQAVQTTQQDDPTFQQTNPLYVMPDFSMGAFYNHEKFFAGFSAPMFLTHDLNTSNSKYRIRNDFSNYNYMLQGGARFRVNREIVVSPSVLFKILPSSSAQLDINATVEYKNQFGLGFSYRSKDALVALLQYRINDQFIAGYAYDYTLSELSRYNNGSHEIFLRYDLNYKVKARDPRFF